eukprot:UN07492
MAKTMEYILAVTALENNASVKVKPFKKASILSPDEKYHDAAIQFLKGKLAAPEALTDAEKAELAAHKSVDNNDAAVTRRVKRAAKYIEDIVNLGTAIQV